MIGGWQLVVVVVGSGCIWSHPAQSPPPHLLYCILSTRTPPISLLLFIRTGPWKFWIWILSMITWKGGIQPGRWSPGRRRRCGVRDQIFNQVGLQLDIVRSMGRPRHFHYGGGRGRRSGHQLKIVNPALF